MIINIWLIQCILELMNLIFFFKIKKKYINFDEKKFCKIVVARMVMNTKQSRDSDLPVMTSRPLVADNLVSPVSLCLVRHW